MAKSILEDAMEDAKLLKETAIENAKNVLVEAISPKIKEFVDSQLGEDVEQEQVSVVPENEMYEDPEPAFGMQMQEEPGLGMEAGPEKHDDKSQDLEMLMQLLKKLGVKLPGMDAGPAPEKGMGEARKDDEEGDEEEEEKVDEVVEITNEDLKSALSEVLGGMSLKSEAHVTKGFGPVQDATLKVSGGKMEKGIAEEKPGEHNWNDVEPPDAKDWTVKEAVYRKKIDLLERSNAALKTENKEYKQACDYLKRNLQEVNLFNSKLLYTNKLLHSAELNNKQRLGVIEAFDRAQSLREVELVYKSLSESLKIAGVLSESKQGLKTMKGPKSSRYVTPSSTVLQEAANRENGGDDFAARMQELAGLVD